MTTRREFILSGAAIAVAGACDINGQPVDAVGYHALFDFDTTMFTGAITEPDGTVNNLVGYHGVGDLPPLGSCPTPTATFSGVVDLPEGFTVPTGETWTLDPDVDTTITVAANIVIHGTLRALPNPGVKHTIRFVGINEATIVGGHTMHPIATDVGLWVDGGILDISGTRKVAWNRTGIDPSWSASDELIVTPTAVGDYVARPFTSGSPVPTASSSTLYSGANQITRTYTAEVVNLSRNVTIESVGGRAHIMFINCTRPQRLAYAEIRNLGPTGKMGRYPLHVHMNGEGTAGSSFVGNVARDCGNNAFVSHESHGCDHSESIAYRTIGNAFWWDANDETNRVRWDRCGAIETQWPKRGAECAGFMFGEGVGNSCVDSFATGTTTYGGAFAWPATANQNEHNVWGVEGCVSHNNNGTGVHVWQNDSNPHAVIGFVSYRNKGDGFIQGAYINRYRYFRCVAFGNTGADFSAHALGDWLVDSCWIERFLVTKHTFASGRPLIEWTQNYPVVSVTIDEATNNGTVGGNIRFVSKAWRADIPRSRVTVTSLLSTIEFANKGESFTLAP